MGEPQLKRIVRLDDAPDIQLNIIDEKPSNGVPEVAVISTNGIHNGGLANRSNSNNTNGNVVQGMANPTFTDTDDPKEKNRHISNKSDRSLDLYDASYDSTDADQESKKFWSNLKSWMIANLNFGFEFTVCEILFGFPNHTVMDFATLMFTRHEKLPMKDFSQEQRGVFDVEKFLKESHIILDLNETNLDGIVDNMLHEILDNQEVPTTIDDAKSALFTHDNAHQLCKVIQGTCLSYEGGVDYDQSWLCILTSLPSVQKRHVCIARLKHPANLGRTSQEVYFIILVVAPTKEKGTKNALETGRTFSTLFADMDLRSQLLAAHNNEEFKKLMWEETKLLAVQQSKHDCHKFSLKPEDIPEDLPEADCWFAAGLRSDLKRRLKFYVSDYKDGIFGHRTIPKTISTTLFLYFACLLPSIALGVLNDNNTHGALGVKHVMFSQTVGGIFFALVGGQPMVILLTTAPLAIFSKVIYNIAGDMDMTFEAMYACTGLWNSFFLIVYSLSGASRLMKWSTRSTEEIFALFISIAFTVDAVKDIVKDFQHHYEPCDFDANTTTVAPTINVTTTESITQTVTEIFSNTTDNAANIAVHGDEEAYFCSPETSLLFLLLVLGTTWVGLYLFNFTKTPFLNTNKREMLRDYALAVSVLVMSFFGSYLFRNIHLKVFRYVSEQQVFQLADMTTLSVPAVFVSCGLGFCLSLLFFMDQNISAAMVSSPDNKLKKGTAYHWDLLVISLLNGVLTVFKMPMMHGALPHSPLHVKAMADMEDRVDQGHVYQHIMHVRENRITPLFSHILIGLSILMLPNPLQYIPPPVLDGLFLYLAVTALSGNQMFERITLFFTEQAAYPPNHYVRHVPQRKMHLFTFYQILQLLVMCAFGFSPIAYMKMCFPVLIMLLLPIRHKLVPLTIEAKHLKAIDGH